MASIETRTRQDGSPSWRVSWRQGGAKHSETFDREAEARRFRGMVDAAGQATPPGWVRGQGFDARPADDRLTVRAWAERSIAARTGITEGTRDRYATMLAQWLYPTLGDVALADVDRERAALWLNAVIATPAKQRGKADGIARPVSGKTVRNVHGLVSSIWSDAIDNDKVQSNPFARLRLPDDAPDRGEMLFLTRDEFKVLHDLAPEHYRLFLRTLIESGLRWGEATALQVRHLTPDGIVVNQAWKADTQGRLVLGSPKTVAGRRTVDIPDALADDLAVLTAGRRGDEFVFRSSQGHPLRNGTFHTRVWIPLMDAAEPILGKRPRIHDLRHSHVAWQMSAGVDVYRIMERMGHTSVATTQGTYGHLIKRDNSDVKAAADSGLGSSSVKPIRTRKRAT